MQSPADAAFGCCPRQCELSALLSERISHGQTSCAALQHTGARNPMTDGDTVKIELRITVLKFGAFDPFVFDSKSIQHPLGIVQRLGPLVAQGDLTGWIEQASAPFCLTCLPAAECFDCPSRIDFSVTVTGSDLSGLTT